MRKIINIAALLALCLLNACMKTSIFIEPIAEFDITPGTTVNLFEPVTFTVTGKGNRITLFTGDQGSNYEMGDIGIVLKSGDSYQYSYSSVGTYDAVLLVTGFYERGENLISKIERKQITVNTGPSYKGLIKKVRFLFRGARIECYADNVTGLKSNYTFFQNQLVKYADVVDDNGTMNCVIHTNYYNRKWEDIQLFPGLPIFEPHPDKYKVEIRTENEHPGITVVYHDETTGRDTLINVNRAQSFIFSKPSGVGYRPFQLKSFAGGNEDTIIYNMYTIPFAEMSRFTIGGVTKENNSGIRMDPTNTEDANAPFNHFYSVFEMAENRSLIPRFSTVLAPSVVVTDTSGKVIKGDGTDDPIDFFAEEPVTFTLTYTDPDFPDGYNRSVSYYTVYTKAK